jgi:hypothetical protein
MRVCLVGALVCSIGAGVAQGEVVQYIFEGMLESSPTGSPRDRHFFWTIWMNTDAIAIPVNESTVRFEDAFYSELMLGTTTYTGSVQVQQLINDFECCGGLKVFDRIDIEWDRDPGQGAPSQFELDFGTLDELFDRPEIRTDPGMFADDASSGFYRLRENGELHTGNIWNYSLRIVPAPSALGLLATAGVVGARRRR